MRDTTRWSGLKVLVAYRDRDYGLKRKAMSILGFVGDVSVPHIYPDKPLLFTLAIDPLSA